MEITKALCLSTVHISQESSRWLDRSHSDYGAPFTVWEGEHGYFFPSYFATLEPEEAATTRARIPADIWAVMEKAHAADCAFVRLDSDGPTVDDLPEYDWE